MMARFQNCVEVGVLADHSLRGTAVSVIVVWILFLLFYDFAFVGDAFVP